MLALPAVVLIFSAAFVISDAAKIQSIYPARGSTEGGTFLVISGSGFMMPVEANPWDSQVVYVGSKICNIHAHYTSSTQIVCQTTPHDVVAESSESLTVSVQMFGGLGLAGYVSKSSAFQYHWYDTPLFYWSDGWAGTGGDIVAFQGDVYPGASVTGQFDIRIGGARCITNQETMPLSSRRRGSLKQVRCQLPDDELLPSGHYNVTVAVGSLDREDGDCPNALCFPYTEEQAGTRYGYGMAAIVPPVTHDSIGKLKRVWGGNMDLETGQLYHYTIYPQVTSIEPTEGGWYGGNNLTLHGTSFAVELYANAVTVGGQPCEVLEASLNKLVCRVGSWQGAARKGHSMRGLRNAGYSSRRRLSYGISSVPAEEARELLYQNFYKGSLDALDSEFPGDMDTLGDHRMRELTGYFVPPLTASYSFYICGDDQSSIEIGSTQGAPNETLQIMASHDTWVTSGEYAHTNPHCWYYREDLQSLPDLSGPTKKVSEPLFLQAGMRYPFRLRNIGYGGWNWFRTGIKVAGLNSAVTAEGSTLSSNQVQHMTAVFPSMEVQAIRLRADGVLREKHYIEIADVTQPGSFRIRMTAQRGQEASMSFSNAVDPGTIRDGVQDANVIIAGEEPYRLHACRSVSVETTETGTARRFTLTFNCPLEVDTTKWLSIEIVSAGMGAATAGLLQQASAPLSGTFIVGHTGTWSAPIEARQSTTSWTYLTEQISSLRRTVDADGQLELECWRHPDGWANGEAFQVLVRFRRPLGDVALLEVNGTDTMMGTGFTLEVYPVEDGDSNAIFLERVPADLFEVPDPSDADVQPVRVVSNGVVGGIGGSNVLGYKYSISMVPVLLSATPTVVDANGTVTLVVSNITAYDANNANWTQDLQVVLGDGAGFCQDFQEVSAHATGITITCMLANVPAGEYYVHLVSITQGQADPSQAPLITVDAVVDAVTPDMGSLAGGSVLALFGVGLRGLNCSNVLVAGVACTEPAASRIEVMSSGSLVCLTPPMDGFNPDDQNNWPSTTPAEITLTKPADRASVVRATFTYASSYTPLLEMLSPSFYSSALSTTILINGSGLASASGETALPIVQFGERMGSVTSQEDWSLHVFLQRAAPTPPLEAVTVPLAWIPGKGFAAVLQSVTFESRFEVTEVLPAIASKAGGVVVFLTGAGFHPWSAAKHLINFELEDGTSRPCEVMNGNETHLSCRLKGGAKPEKLPETLYGDDTFMRRLSGDASGPPTASTASKPQLRCHAGADDHSKVRCFAQAMARAGSLRSLPSDTAGGRTGEMLEWIRRAELEGGGKPMVDVVYDIDDTTEDAPVLGPETQDGEPARRLQEEDVTDAETGLAGLPRWGVASDEAEDFRLMHMRTKHFHGKEFKRSSEPSSVLLQEPGWTEVEDFGAEDDSDGHSLGRSLAYDNSSDSSEIGPPEILTLALSLNGVVPTCRALEGCGLNLTDAATPVVKRVTPRNGSYADGINVVITLSMMDKPEQVQIFFGPFECPNPVVSQSGGDWTITVPLCSFEASKTPVYVLTSSGYAVGASPITGAGFYFEQLLRLSSIVASSGSFYGGTLVAIRGAGLGPSLGMNYATVGGTPCEVASASNDEVQCYTPAAPSELANANESTRTLEVKVHVMSAEVATKAGLVAEYFFFTQGRTLPNLDSRVPDLRRIEANVDYPATSSAWHNGMSVVDNFAVRWTGYVTVTSSGSYTFFLGSDDGSKLYLNGAMVIDNDGAHGFETRTSLPLQLSPGPHRLTLLFYEGVGSSGVRLQYRGPDTGGSVITVPSSVLSHGEYAEVPTLSYTYNEPSASPTIENLTETGRELELLGTLFGSSGMVTLGTASNPNTNFHCVASIWTDTRIVCERPDLPSGAWQVRVYSDTDGWSNPAPVLIWVDLTISSVESNGINVSATRTEHPWILVMKLSQGGVLGYNSQLWTNTDLLNPESPEDRPDNAKYQAYLDVPFRRLRACVGSSHGQCIYHSFESPWSSALALFSAGYVRDTSVDQAGMVQAFGATPGSYRTCPMMKPGFNLECAANNRARWGFCANCPSQRCHEEGEDADAAVGIGLTGQSSDPVGAGWTSYFASGGGTCEASSTTHRDVWLWVENMNITDGGVEGSLYSGYGGGVTVALQGAGFGFEASQTRVTVCGEPCEVSTSDGSSVKCTAPSMTDQELIDTFPESFPSIDLATVASKFYTDRGEFESQLSELAFTSSIDQQIDMSMGLGTRSSDCWFGFELPPSKEAFLTAVDFFPPTDPNRRAKVAETVFEVRSFSGNLTWTEVASVRDTTITGSTIAQGWTSFPIVGVGPNGSAVAQAFRVRILPDACRSSGEIMRGVRFRGILLNKGNTNACPIEVDSVSHPLASAIGGSALLPVVLSYSVERTPVVAYLTPNRGTARGDTLVTLLGQGLEPLDSQGSATSVSSDNAQITFNQYPCRPDSANSTALSCYTTERNAGIFAPFTQVFLGGRGYAIISLAAEDTVFRYVDKWSNIYSWQDSEPPVDGDSVVVPEGQAIMLDVDSPKLFLLLISGYFEFDRKDLQLDSTYIWIAGGNFYVGSEAAPFLHQATITLHGDRWHTIELPVIGSKMLAVTDLGGLGTCAHLYDRNVRLSQTGKHYVDPCPVKLVGRLELHGRPGISWTRLVETAPAGADLLKLEEAVDWEIGTEVVITPSERHAEEVRKVLSLEDNGFTLRLDEPLRHEHLGTWYYNDEIPTPTDLRAAVGRLNRNVKVQGDEKSLSAGNSFMFGVHIGAFHGGIMRIENTEITRSGQAANFGRYSSHWHVLSPHRTVDVADVAFLRNNSYHDTFQRAVVVHSTDFAVVRDNVALKTKGHSFFTEAGDEVFTLYEHNLAVHPLQHPLLLDDDMDPAGFWMPGFMGWHRSNLAANCHRGWRVRKISGPAGAQTDLTFFNNSAHASGFGWHLKPPHAPPTLNTFNKFTAFRCSTGMFYYGTGNIFHDDHRFIECGTGHFMNHLSNGLHTAPFYHNLVLVGNMDPEATSSRMGRGVRSAKDNEYFYISGATVINLHDSAAFEGCFETTCTMRYERVRWFNSSRRTFSSSGKMAGIFWDMDGTLTGYPNGFVSKFYDFNTFPQCQVVPEHVNGIVCGASDGSVRVRRLKVDGQEPWQLDGKRMNVRTDVGFDQVEYDFFKVRGWAIPMLENETYDIKVDDPNDFQKIQLQYSERNYVMEEHGYLYTKIHPKSEDILLHLNYTDWRDHFDATQGERLSRLPNSDDPFGSFSMILRQDQCDEFNLTDSAAEKCGVYVNDTGLELKALIDEQPENPMVNGRLTTTLTMKVVGDNVSGYQAGPGTPGGSFRQQFTPRECPKSGCPQPQKGADGYLPQRRWSDAAGWPDGKLPGEMDNVVLPPEDNVLLDIVTPKLHWLDIQGKLEFDRALNCTLNAHSVKVWGRLHMGTTENPMPPNVKAEIVLWGSEQSITVIMVEGLFLVNKVISVLGEFSAVGTPRTSQAWTKLSQTAAIGSTQPVLMGNLADWGPGSQVAISATEYPSPPQTTETEVRRITGMPVYDANSDTTTITLDSALTHRHFAGVVDSSAENTHWPRPFLAAAVALLDGRSNVVLKTGEDWEEHGGEVVIGGSSDGNWEGIATISNVDFIRMGKFWYQAPALKFNFLGGQKNMSRVENCVFSYSQSGAIEANYVSHLELVDNVFHRTTRTAVWIRGTSSHDAVVLRRNIAIETLRHPNENTEWIRHFGSFYLEVRPAELYGNVAAGSCDTGFILRPQMKACQKGDLGLARLQQEELNEAVATMTGVFILDACQDDCDQCAQVHGLVAWKSAHGGIMSGDQNANVRLDTILLADNHIGMALRFVRATTDMNHRTYSYNISVFGSTAASTCDASTECRAYGETDAVGVACNSVVGDYYRRVGIMTHMINNIPKFCEAEGITPCRPPTTPIKMCVMPWEERMGSAGSRYSESHWDGVTFGHWSSSDCGKPSVAFTYNPTNIDIAYPQFFTGVKWLPSVEAGARVYLGESGITHNSVVATGEFDGVNQLVLTDVDGSLLGSTPDASLVTVYNPALAIQTCTEVGSSYFQCPELQLRYLTWEAVGGPENRVLSKFKAWRASDDRDTWSTGPQEEKTCLPVGAEHDRSWKLRPNDMYNLTMFTSPPKHHRLFWFNDNPDETIRLDIFLTQPFRLEVYVDGSLMSEDLYDTAKKSPARLPELTDPHGSYAFDPQARRFYLVMQGGFFDGRAASVGGGFILLRLLQVVQVTMTVSMPLADFDSVEQDKFVSNVAALLAIDPARIKIVQVQSKAQVAAQGGRLLEALEMLQATLQERLLQGEELSVIFQIVEENPEPVPGEAFADSGVPPPAGQTWDAIVPTAAPGSPTTGSGSFEFSGAAITELAALVQILQNASDAGVLSDILQIPVVLEAIELTDVPTDQATSNTTTTSNNFTTTETTLSTTFASTTTSDPNATTEPEEAVPEDPTVALVQSILIGAVVGVAVGIVMMVVGYFVRRRWYSNTVATDEPADEALNP